MGRLAQLVERLPYKQRVSGSIPLTPIIKRSRSVAVITSPCHGEDRGFDSRRDRQSEDWIDSLAQSVEHLTFNQRVAGSSPARVIRDAGLAELADAPDLGSGAFGRGGSSPLTRIGIEIGRLSSVGRASDL